MGVVKLTMTTLQHGFDNFNVRIDNGLMIFYSTMILYLHSKDSF